MLCLPNCNCFQCALFEVNLAEGNSGVVKTKLDIATQLMPSSGALTQTA
jgi:hypothetical protein